MDEKRKPETLWEAYEFRDASATSGEWDFYQECVYRLRAKEYRSRDIQTEESVRRREQSRAETLLAEAESTRHPWWRRMLGWWK